MSFLPPYKPTTWKVIAGIAALVLLGIIFWAFSGGKGKDETPLITNIGVDEGKNNVINALVTNQEQVVNNAANNTNQAINAFHDSVNRDSNSFSGSSTDRFCQRFPCDSTCLAWRKSRPDTDCR